MEGAPDFATDGFVDPATDGSTESIKEGTPNFVMDGADDLAALGSTNLVLEGEID